MSRLFGGVNNNDHILIMEAVVVVLGDLGRSPRMLNHSQSLLESNASVDLVGYLDNSIPENLNQNPRLKVHSMSSFFLKFARKLPRLLFIFYAALRILLESLQLFWILMKLRNKKFILVQNPPCIPAFLVVFAVSCIKCVPFCIDWHNYGYTILEVNKRPPVVCKLAYWFEKWIGKFGNAHFCVSEGMKQHLKLEMGIEAQVVYDRPKKSVVKKKYDMRQVLGIPKNYFLTVTSTSWTPDENIGFVLEAVKELQSYDLALVITGKGPLREFYKEEIKKLNLEKALIKVVWLEWDQYPQLLQQCDLGICLHVSSSGLDLPMKVVDMQAAELPALAYDYSTITEFIQPRVNGLLFKDSEQLARAMVQVMKDKEELLKYKQHIAEWKQKNTWEDHWTEKGLPVLREVTPSILRTVLFWMLVTTVTLKFFV